MLTAEQRKDLQIVMQEYNTLTNKMRMTKQEESRCAYLQVARSSILSGMSLAELDEESHNVRARERGLPTVQLSKPLTEEEVRATAWQALVERRDMVEGAPMLSQLGTYTGLGYFVPTGFFPQLYRSLKAHDALFDEDAVTVIKSKTGAPFAVPLASDTENGASVVGEAVSQTSVDFDSTNHAILGAYSYASRRVVVSQESFQDLSSAVSAMNLTNEILTDYLARGIGADLVNGTGGGVKPLGLIPSLKAQANVPIVTAVGSSSNDGSGNTGSNSLGSLDFSAAIGELDNAYFSAKTAWMMNRSTLATLSGQLDKYGNIVDLVKYINGQPTIFGIPVKICPSMDSIGASKVPVVLGDFRYWATRLVTADEGIGLKTYTNAPGLAERGNIGIRSFMRADGALLWSSFSGSPTPGNLSPFVMIQNHS